MFDPFHHQAAGLRAVAGTDPIRVIPVALTQATESGFDLVWMLAAGLSSQGHAVVVLDVSSEESPERRGLMDVIRGADPTSCGDAEAQWMVLPALQGIDAIFHKVRLTGGMAVVEALGAFFDPGTVVLLMASAACLDTLMDGRHGRPLLPVVSDAATIIETYGALKTLRRTGCVNPVLVPMHASVTDALELQVVRVLMDTADRHLCWSPEVWSLPLASDHGDPVELGNWLLRILESAVVLDTSTREQPFTDLGRSITRGALVPQLWSC